MAHAFRQPCAQRLRAAALAAFLAIAVAACGNSRTIPPATGSVSTPASQPVTDPIGAEPPRNEVSAPAKHKEASAPAKHKEASAPATHKEASARVKVQVEPALPRVPPFALAPQVPDKLAGLRAEDVFEPARLFGLSRARIEALLGGPGFVRRDEPAIVWRYANGHCFLEVFFYREEGDYVVNHVEARGRSVFRMAVKACFLDLLGARANGGSG